MMHIDTDDTHDGWNAQKGINPKHTTDMNTQHTTTEQPGQSENQNSTLVATRKKCLKSYKANIRLFDDYSIEACPQAVGEPSQLEVKKVGRSKRYVTNGKNPLACIELKVPADVPDRATAFFKELDRLTRDIQTHELPVPEGELLVNEENLKVRYTQAYGKVTAWLTIQAASLAELRRELYNRFIEIDKCLAAN